MNANLQLTATNTAGSAMVTSRSLVTRVVPEYTSKVVLLNRLNVPRGSDPVEIEEG